MGADRMTELTLEEVFPLFFSSEPPTDRRVALLAAIVLDLMMEVEALRDAAIRTNTERPAQSGASPYAEAYRDTAYLTHDATGPSGGRMKLLARFYPRRREEPDRAWRESILMERLGCSAADIATYKCDAEAAELFT